MQNDQLKYKFENLIENESFRAWVIENDVENGKFWTQTMVLLPQHKKKILLAKAFLLSLKPKSTDLNQAQLMDITDTILAKAIRAEVYS